MACAETRLAFFESSIFQFESELDKLTVLDLSKLTWDERHFINELVEALALYRVGETKSASRKLGRKP